MTKEQLEPEPNTDLDLDVDRDFELELDAEEPPPRGPRPPWPLLIVLATAGLFLLQLAPRLDRMIDAIGQSREPISIGAVTSVQFVDGFGPKTQIDTEQGSFLLEGTVSLKAGTPLQQRWLWTGGQVCETGTTTCWPLLSK